MTNKKLLEIISEEEQEQLRALMLKDNLYKQNIYYNNYLKQLKKKYSNNTLKNILIISFLFFIGFLIIKYYEDLEHINNHIYKDNTPIVNNKLKDKEIKNTANKILYKHTTKVTYNFGYCTSKICEINVFNHEKGINEYIKLDIKYQTMVLSFKKGNIYTLEL